MHLGDNQMELKWFAEDQAHGGVRHRLYKRNTKMGAWGQTDYFVDASPNSAHNTMGEKYGLYGSGMGELVTMAHNPYRIAACFGGFKRLSLAKKQAEKLLLG
jgi:hypothetical protein